MSDLCKRGHELAGDNLLIQHGRRVCRTCDQARKRDWQSLKALGNGVVPPQAAAALRLMLDRIEAAA